MAKVEIRVVIKNRFIAFEQEGDDDVTGELLEKFNLKKEEKALKKAIKNAAKEKSRPEEPVAIDVSPKNEKTHKTESTVEDNDVPLIDEKKKKKKKKRVESVSEVVVDERPRERVVYQGGKEYTKKTHSTFAAKMLALAREAERSARNDKPFRDKEGFTRDRERYVEPSYEANVTATKEVSSGQFVELPKNERLYRVRGGFRQAKVGSSDHIQHVSCSETAAAVVEEASSSLLEETPKSSNTDRRRVRFSDQVQKFPSSENASTLTEEVLSNKIEERSKSRRPYRSRGGYKKDRGDVRQTEPEVKQYTLNEWKEMQAEIRKNSSLNVAKSKEYSKENGTEEKNKAEKVVKQETSKTNVQIKFGSSSYYDVRRRGRGGMDRRDFRVESRASRVFANAPNVSDLSAFPRLK